MRLITTFVLLFVIFFNLADFAFAKRKNQQSGRTQNFVEFSEQSNKWAEKTLRKMTVEEKVGQLVSIGINAQFWNEDNDAFLEIKRQIVENKIGGVCLFGAPVYESVQVTNRMQTLAKVPLLISSDFEAGIGMRFADTVNFPWNMALAATGEPDLARRQGEFTAREARALGVQHVFAPVVDVNNNALNPVINVRSYGENPGEVARFANAFINGLQANGALATAKHFPGHGDTAVDSHRGLPIINLPRSRFDAVEFAPFKAAIETGVASIMTSHISVPQLDSLQVKPLQNAVKSVYADSEITTENATIPATLSPAVQTEILRNNLNFRGLIVTDAMDMSGLTLYFNQAEAAVLAFLAGADMILKPADANAAVRGLREAVSSNRISQTRLDQSVKKILASKYELGLVRNRLASFAEIERTVASKAARDLAEEIADKAVTLVRNDADLIPLQNKSAKFFVLGLSNGEDRAFVANTFLRTLRQNNIQFESAILDERSTVEEMQQALQKARQADVIFAPLYGRVRTGARTSVGLPENASKALRELLGDNKNVIGVSFGNPYLLGAFPEFKTYLVAYGDMSSLQRASTRAILGQQNITGRLPITLPGLHERNTGIQIIKR